MRRREPSDQELDAVIKLRQRGASWLRIQKEIDIPRRVAKRAYEDWERSRSLEELKAARKDVASEEFRKHLGYLTQLAENLVDHLDVPESPNATANAEQVLYHLWRRDIGKELEARRPSRPTAEKEVRRIVRQNRLLFKALQDHTREAIRWETLEEWKQAWNNCIESLVELRKEARKVMGNILNLKPNLKRRIEKEGGGKDAIEQIERGVLEVIWRGILNGRPDQGRFSVRIGPQGEGITQASFGEADATLEPTFAEKGLAEEVAGVCNWALQNLCREGVVQRADGAVRTMRARIGELEETLDPLILRPLILRSRCDLCPA